MKKEHLKPDGKRLILLKSVYFLGGLSGATWGRFSTIYFNQILKLSPAQIGIIEAIIPAVRFIFTPIWGVIADLYHAKKSVYLFTTLISSIILLFQAFPSIANGFYPVLLINGGLSAFVASGVLDAHTLEWLAETDNTRLYGSIRLWTAVSWGIGNVVMGYITDHFKFYYNFILFGIFALFRIIAIWIVIPNKENKRRSFEKKLLEGINGEIEEEKGEEKEEEEEKNATKSELYAVIFSKSFLFLLLEVALIGAAIGIVERLLFVYLQNDLNASTFLCGLTVLITVIFELPIFLYTDALLNLLGVDGMFVFSMIAYVVRAFGYTYLTKKTVWYVLIFEALHGFTFALMWSAAVEYAKSRSPKGWNSTVQSILMTAYQCLGTGIGSGIGGWVAETKGFIFLYRGAGIIIGSVCLLHIFTLIVKLIVRKCCCSSKNKNNNNYDELTNENEKVNS